MWNWDKMPMLQMLSPKTLSKEETQTPRPKPETHKFNVLPLLAFQFEVLCTISQGGDSSKNPRHARPGYAISHPIHRLPVRDLPVTKHPLPLSLPLSTSYYNFSASPIQKPPLPLCEFNKSTLYFILDFHSAVLTSKKHPLKLVFGLSIVGKILISPPPLGTIF